MTLNEIKILCIKNGVSMKELALKLGFSREYMYRQIKKKDRNLIENIKKTLPK